MSTRQASCFCGDLRVTCDGEPVRISICFCRSCQRRTGSAFGVQARFPEASVRIDGATRLYEREREDGGRVTFHACPSCGSTVFWQMSGVPGFYAVAVGAFADAEFPGPTVVVFEAHRLPWAPLPPTVVEHHD